MRTVTRICLILLMFNYYMGAVAQQSAIFHRPEPDELKMSGYPADSSADAVVLSDIGSAVVTKDDLKGYVVVYKRHVRIKILKKSGLEQATILVPFLRLSDRSEDRFDHISGITHNLMPDGTYQTNLLMPDAIFEEQRSEQMYVKRFTLPNVRVGSVIEYRYEITSNFVFELREWDFQREIPVRLSQYSLDVMKGFAYRVLFQGMEPLIVDSNQETAEGISYRWAMAGLPALREEPYMLGPENYRAKVWFELIQVERPDVTQRKFAKTWADMDQTLIADKDFGGALRKTNFLKPVAQAVLASAASTDTLQWIQAAHKYITQVMTWDNKRGMYASGRGLKDCYEAKTGGASDLNLLLVGLLNEMGVEAQPVILSTKKNGTVSKEFPLLTKFDYTIGLVRVDGKDILLDATDPLLKVGSIPIRCLNGEGRLVVFRKSRWVPLTASERWRVSGQLRMQIQPDGAMKGTASFSYYGYAGADTRHQLVASGADKFKQKFKSQNPGWKWNSLEVLNTDKIDEGVTVKAEVSLADEGGLTPDRIYLHPVPIASMQNNPFKAPERRYPVDMGTAVEEYYVASYTLPEGYTVEEAPKNMSIALPDNGGKFLFLLQASGNHIQVSSRLLISKPLFMPHEYESLRMFYDKMIAKLSEQLILVKGQPVSQTAPKNE